jgi:hypothetical protein
VLVGKPGRRERFEDVGVDSNKILKWVSIKFVDVDKIQAARNRFQWHFVMDTVLKLQFI